MVDFESILNEKQKQIKEEFLSSRSKPFIYLEECACGTRDYHYEITPSGTGDSVYLICGDERIWLDDGLVA